MVFRGLFSHPTNIAQQKRSQVPYCPQPTQWEAPPQGKLKLNWDAALDKISCKVGVGAVISDGEGRVLATLRMQNDLYPDPLTAKAFAAL